MPLSQKDFFLSLDAPLVNARWSWGSVRRDGVVFLRVWQDLVRKLNGRMYVRVAVALDEEDEGGSPGYVERLKHVELVRGGARCYLVMCQADDIDAIPRKVKDFDSEHVFLGAKTVQFSGDWWIEVGSRVPVRDIALKGK